jgi:hypothetical protein
MERRRYRFRRYRFRRYRFRRYRFRLYRCRFHRCLVHRCCFHRALPTYQSLTGWGWGTPLCGVSGLNADRMTRNCRRWVRSSPSEESQFSCVKACPFLHVI